MSLRVTVFCSSRGSIKPTIFQSATVLSHFLASGSHQLIYGGAQVGLMGHFADQVLKLGGYVHGIIPDCLKDVEIIHQGLSKLEIVTDMMERKKKMIFASDVFVVFPGGIGTLDEALEVLTWKYLKEIQQPILFYNHQNFWEPFYQNLKHFVNEGMIGEDVFRLYESHDTILSLIESLKLKNTSIELGENL